MDQKIRNKRKRRGGKGFVPLDAIAPYTISGYRTLICAERAPAYDPYANFKRRISIQCVKIDKAK